MNLMVDKVELLKSNKGGSKIIYRGYMYTIHKRIKGRIRWRCSRRSLYCKNAPLNFHQPDLRPDIRSQTIACQSTRVATPCFVKMFSDRMNKSPVWVHFDIWEKDEKFVVCKLCGGRFSRGGIGKTASTTPMLNHIKKIHSDEYNKLYPNRNKGSITTGSGLPTINLPHNHLPDMQALMKARSRSVLMEVDPSGGPTSPPRRSISPVDVIPIEQDPQTMLQVEQLDSEFEGTSHIAEPESLLKPSSTTSSSPGKSSTSAGGSSAPMANPAESAESEMCLRWNSHHANMSTVIPALMDDERYVDVTIMAEGQVIKCHKLILSSCSNYFDEMLKNTNSNQQTIIFLRDIQFWQIKALIDFMYKGEVNVDQSKLESLLKAAEDLQIKGLAGKSPKKEPETNEPPPKLPAEEPEIKLKEIKAEQGHFLEDMLLEEADDDEEYLPHMENKRGKYKKTRKRKVSTPPDPSLLKHVKINLRGTKSRPNIKQPKFFSPDYPEYDPDRCVSPPKLETDSMFHIDNIKLEPIDIEVPQSPTFFEMNSMMDKSLSESCTSLPHKPPEVVKETKVYSKAKDIEERVKILEMQKPSTSKEIIIESLEPPEKIMLPTKIGKDLPNKDILNLNKKAIIVKCQNVKKLIDENSSIQKILDAATTKQTLTETEKSKLPQIRVRNLPTTETMLKKFATTQLTSILKKETTPSKHIILKKVGTTKPTILRHSLPAKTKEFTRFTTEVQETDEPDIAEKISLLAKTKRELGGEATEEGRKENEDLEKKVEEN